MEEGEAVRKGHRAAAGTVSSNVDRAAPLSEAERLVWCSVGLDFDDEGAIVRGVVRSDAAFADLVRRSVRGHATMATLLGVDTDRVGKLVVRRSLYAFHHEGDLWFPGWQVTSRGVLPGLGVVVAALDPDLHPLAVDHWMNATNFELVLDGGPVPPVVWLQGDGDASRVAALAVQL